MPYFVWEMGSCMQLQREILQNICELLGLLKQDPKIPRFDKLNIIDSKKERVFKNHTTSKSI
jgi:hypothetical protein